MDAERKANNAKTDRILRSFISSFYPGEKQKGIFSQPQ